MEIPPVATLVIHRVADWDVFKKTFDEHQVARKEASILGHHVNRGADDPNMVYIYTPASDVNRLRAFIDGAGLGEPDWELMVPRHHSSLGTPSNSKIRPEGTDLATEVIRKTRRRTPDPDRAANDRTQTPRIGCYSSTKIFFSAHMSLSTCGQTLTVTSPRWAALSSDIIVRA